MSRFSVIVPVFNREAVISRCLDSIFAQEKQPFEVIVINDGSTDSTNELLLSKKHPALRVVEIENSGPGYARNVGMNLANGDYICFLDSDDVWFPDTLSNFQKVIDETGRPSFISGRAKICLEGDVVDSCREGLKYRGFDSFLNAFEAGVTIGGTGSIAIRRNKISGRKGFAENVRCAEDTDLWMQLCNERKYVFVEQPELFVYYRSDDTAVRNEKCMFDGLNYIIERERSGIYPGGVELSRARQTYISSHVRPAVVSMIRQGSLDYARRLALKTFYWHVRAWKLKFILFVLLRAVIPGRGHHRR